jgi:Mlc titration factor MtfA (ptsG expression regulator)
MIRWLRRRRRATLRQKALPAAWHAIIERNVPYVSRLPAADRDELGGHVQVFLAEKSFEGCGGLDLTDEIRVTIAAQACILLLHRETDYFAKLVSILVYPSTYLVPGGQHVGAGIMSADEQARLGESWISGVVVLVWDSVLAGARDMHDGHNVVLHEFAHQLDQEDGASDGAPILPQHSRYVAWARVLGHDFDALVEATRHAHHDVIDRYGATNPAEFFAVVTELFFEKPRQLKDKHPELYAQLQQFYRQDPLALTESRGESGAVGGAGQRKHVTD